MNSSNKIMTERAIMMAISRLSFDSLSLGSLGSLSHMSGSIIWNIIYYVYNVVSIK